MLFFHFRNGLSIDALLTIDYQMIIGLQSYKNNHFNALFYRKTYFKTPYFTVFALYERLI